jgi:hypothetical protein
MITAQDIKEAYEQTGLKPICQAFIKVSIDEEVCGCALTSLFLKYEGKTVDYLKQVYRTHYDGDFMGKIMSTVEEKGYNRLFLRGIIHAFDGEKVEEYINHIRTEEEVNQYMSGYRVGQEARELINPINSYFIF